MLFSQTYVYLPLTNAYGYYSDDGVNVDNYSISDSYWFIFCHGLFQYSKIKSANRLELLHKDDYILNQMESAIPSIRIQYNDKTEKNYPCKSILDKYVKGSKLTLTSSEPFVFEDIDFVNASVIFLDFTTLIETDD